MNPTSGETGLNPPASVEQTVVGPVVGENIQPLAEQAPATAELPTRTGQTAALPPIPLPLPPADGTSTSPPSNAASAITQSVTLASADDDDLIEKEWVNKAKAIVEHTRDDPHRQSEELTVVKADYMKKRYDKIIKVNK